MSTLVFNNMYTDDGESRLSRLVSRAWGLDRGNDFMSVISHRARCTYARRYIGGGRGISLLSRVADAAFF